MGRKRAPFRLTRQPESERPAAAYPFEAITMADGKLLLYRVDGSLVGEATVKDGDVVFPTSDATWTWVLDARKEPYHELKLEEIRTRADHARKKFVLIAQAEG